MHRARAARYACFVLLPSLTLAGCSRTEEYLEVFRDQRAAWSELAGILESVKDEKSMVEAKTVLDNRAAKFDAIVRRANALPKPAPAEVQKRLAEEKYRLLKDDPRHPSLQLKRVGRFWSCRVGLHYRTLGVDVAHGELVECHALRSHYGRSGGARYGGLPAFHSFNNSLIRSSTAAKVGGDTLLHLVLSRCFESIGYLRT